MRQRLLPACLAGLLLLAPLALVLAAPLPTAIEDRPLATRAALDALFSMAALVPEGAGPATPPPGFSPDDADEATLIAFLARQKRRGADLDAYRQLGTPLHHTIRVGLHGTARWLLANGADPRLRVRDAAEAPTGFPPPDALGVAVAAGAWKLVDSLLRHPAYAALSPREKARAIWPYALASAGRTAGLLGRRVALPVFSTDPELAGALLRHALCSGQAALAGPLLASDDGRGAAGSFGPSDAGCPRIEGGVAPDRLPARSWQDIEQRLGQPVLPWLAIQAATPAQAARLLAAGLRSPWGEPAALGLYVRHALRAPAGIPLLRAVPPDALRSALNDDAILAEWLATSVDWPQADLDWALAQVAPARLAGQLGPLLERWGYSRLAGRGATDRAARLARWAALTDRLAAPLPPVGNAAFLYVVPPELWSRWFALGYRPADHQWADWLTSLEPAGLERVWPLIARHQPEIARRALTWLVAPLSVGPIDDPEARRLSHRGLYHHDPGFLAKARFIAARAGRVTQPRWLAAGLAVDKPEPGVALALAEGWVKPAPVLLRRQLEPAPLACQPRPGPGLRRALAVSGELLDADGVVAFIDAVQPLARPGATACEWLVSGGGGGGRQYIDEESFSQGVNRLTPCPDAWRVAALWQEGSGWRPIDGEVPVGPLMAIRIAGSGLAGLAAGEVDYGTCGQRAAEVFMPQFKADGGLAFKPVGPGDALFDALALQCSFRNLAECPGLSSGQATPAAALGVTDFADRHWAAGKAAFLDALARLDREKLAEAEAQGLFAHWLDEAARGLAAAPGLSLPERRRRMAWLQARRSPRPAYSDDTVASLVPWLPAEDWTPLIEALRCSRPATLDAALARARELNRADLERRLQRARSQDCEASP